MKKVKVLAFSLIGALSTSIATVCFAAEGDALTAKQQQEIKAIQSYHPSVKGLDLKHPETWNLKQSVGIQVPVESSGKVSSGQVSTSSTSTEFVGAKGYTYVVDEGLYYEGVHGTIPYQLTPVVVVNAWLGKQSPSASKITWVDNQEEIKYATKSAADVTTGTNKKAKGSVGTLIYGEAAHSITFLTGTYTATTNDAKIIE
ncbi:hypothetical protein GS458_1812 [Geobacillus stearothermophilus]|nr:hypothetical protein GS458_1812 [Geobacillus stearothermophilus]